ncbi:hypothetical protein OH77DRAFT_1592402 [Trametes cingulata]|nr:hypothetical protein OH77DRAFT_1592402 [Trametes cingulata]
MASYYAHFILPGSRMDSSDLFKAPAPPPPPEPVTQCRSCAQGILGPLQLCSGLGSQIQNYNRWYQRCLSCGAFLWHGPPTPLDAIPEHIQLRHAYNKSLRENSPGSAATGSPSFCGNPVCVPQRNGRARRANRECVHTPPLCMQCCKSRGMKCTAHKVSTTSTAEGSIMPPSPAVYALPTQHVRSPTPEVTPGQRLEDALSQPAPWPGATQPAAENNTLVSPLLDVPQGRSVNLETSAALKSGSTTRSYARPLPDGYAKAYIAAHRKHAERVEQVDAEREVSAKLANLVRVCLWLKVEQHTTLRRINVSTPHVGSLVISKHSTLVDALHPQGCVEVYSLLDREWALQDLDLPIRVPPANPRVFLRLPGMQDSDCIGLADEIASATSASALKRVRGGDSVPSTPMKVRRIGLPDLLTPDDKIPALATASTVVCATGDLDKAGNPTPELQEGPKATGTREDIGTSLDGGSAGASSFPLTYVCDMHIGMEKLLHVNHNIQEEFKAVFPGIPWVKSTYYANRTIFIQARTLNLVDAYVKRGRTPAGRWSALANEVKAMRTTRVTRPQPDAVMSMYVARLEWFESSGADFGTRWSPDTEAIEVFISTLPEYRGHMKEIYAASIPDPRRFAGGYVAKAVREDVRPVDWRERFVTNTSIHFREAQRVARGCYIAELFLYEISQSKTDAVLATRWFRFAATYLVTATVENQERAWIFQKHVAGLDYPSPTDAEKTSKLAMTLSAFSHYSLERYRTLYTAFKAFYDTSESIYTINIYDCETST